MPEFPRIEEALRFALELHRGQTRRGTLIPYAFHLLAVASLVAEAGGDEAQIIAALLHDAIEDAGGAPTRREIRDRFGEDVVQLVESCTDTDQDPKPPWRERKEAFLDRLSRENDRALLIVAADKLHNVRSTIYDLRVSGERIWSRFNGGEEGTLWYFGEIVRTLRRVWDHPLLEEVALAVETLNQLAAATSTGESPPRARPAS
jgi:(p)ppGpp synthase/HD superfamily hydrolase